MQTLCTLYEKAKMFWGCEYKIRAGANNTNAISKISQSKYYEK